MDPEILSDRYGEGGCRSGIVMTVKRKSQKSIRDREGICARGLVRDTEISQFPVRRH